MWTTLTFSLYLEHSRHTTASGPILSQFLLPSGSPPRFLQCSNPHFFLVFAQMTLFQQTLPWLPSLKLQLFFYLFSWVTPDSAVLVVFLHSTHHHLTNYLFYLLTLFVFILVPLQRKLCEKKNLYLFCSLLSSLGPWMVLWTIGAQRIFVEWINECSLHFEKLLYGLYRLWSCYSNREPSSIKVLKHVKTPGPWTPTFQGATLHKNRGF